MAEENENRGVSIKQEGFAMLINDDKVSVKFDGKEMMAIQSIRIEMACEEVTKAYITVPDVDLDLENIPFEINVDELQAHKLLKGIKQQLLQYGPYFNGTMREVIVRDIDKVCLLK